MGFQLMNHPKISMGDGTTLLLGFGEYGIEFEVAANSGDATRVLGSHAEQRRGALSR